VVTVKDLNPPLLQEWNELAVDKFQFGVMAKYRVDFRIEKNEFSRGTVDLKKAVRIWINGPVATMGNVDGIDCLHRRHAKEKIVGSDLGPASLKVRVSVRIDRHTHSCQIQLLAS
jgi:hypothetical protein